MDPAGKFWRGAMQCDVVQSTKFVKFCTVIKVKCSPQAKILKIYSFLIDFGAFFKQSGNTFCMLHPLALFHVCF